MKTRKAIYAAAAFATLGVTGVLYVLFFSPDIDGAPVGVFEKAGFQVLVPHVDEQPPGYFDTVERQTPREVSLHRTCDIPYAEIEPLILRTRTVDEEITQKLSAGYETDASVLAVHGSVELEGVRHVHVRFENSAIWYLTTESLYRIREKYLQGSCEAAVEKDLQKGLLVCQTKKVIVSDIVFEVTYDSGAQTKVTVPSASASAEVDAARHDNHDIRGRKMFHAVKLDEACFSLNSNSSAG